MKYPYICDQCNHVAFNDHFVQVGEGVEGVLIQGIAIAKSCPNCQTGNMVLPTGGYTSYSVTYFNQSDWTTIRTALQEIHAALQRGQRPEEMAEIANRYAWVWGAIRKYLLPENFRDNLSLISLLLVVINVFIMQARDSNEAPQPTIAVPSELVEILKRLEEKAAIQNAASETQAHQPEQPPKPPATEDNQTLPPQ